MARGVYKRGNVYWIRYAGLDGRIVRESSGGIKFKEAEDLLIERKQSIREGKQPVVKRIANYTFNELAKDYKTWAERQNAYCQKEQVIDQLIERFGNYQLRKFTTKLVEQYQTERLKQGKPRKKRQGKLWIEVPMGGNKPATINRHTATLKHMFTKAVEWEMVEEEVLKRIRRVKQLKENNSRLRYLSKEECIKLIDKCPKHIKPIVIMAMNTGMRKGEILNLKWDNVDLKHGFILLDKTKNGDRREIPINNSLRNVLTGITRRLDVPYVFYDEKRGTHYQRITRSFNTAAKNAKINDFRFHDLRHTFASHLVMSGVDLTTIKELLGHKTITMTLRYAHLAPSHKVKAVDILDDTLSIRSSAQKVHKKEVTNHV